MSTRRIFLMLAPLAVVTTAWGQTTPAVRVDAAWARRAPMLQGTGTGAVYAALVNGGKTSDALLSASTDAASVTEIHETFQDAGLSRMRQVPRIDVAPGSTVEMKPGGYHLMLMGLTRDLKPGEVVSLTLVFRNAGKVAVKAQVK